MFNMTRVYITRHASYEKPGKSVASYAKKSYDIDNPKLVVNLI